MTNFEKTQLTDLGTALVGKSGFNVNFTRVETGCGTYASEEEVGGAVSLKSKVQDVAISNASRLNEVLSEVKFLISNKELTTDYLLTEIGVYAMDPDVGEILYAICYAVPENSQKILAYNGIFSFATIISLKIEIAAGAEVRFETLRAYALAEDYVRQQEELEGLRDELTCNLLHIADFTKSGSNGGAFCTNGEYGCSIPDANVIVWNGEIALPEGGYAYPASSDTADVLVAYSLDGEECQVEISGGAVLPEGAVVTEYRLNRKDGESRIVADIWPMISPGKRLVSEFVPYTGDERKMNRCIAFVLKTVEKLREFCLNKFLPSENVANNLVTTEEGYALDARQGKVLQDEIDEINTGLIDYCSTSFYISIPNHTATLTFIRVGQYCMAYIDHYCQGDSYESKPMNQVVPDKYRPSNSAYFHGTTRVAVIGSDGNVALYGTSGDDIHDYGYVMYSCLN